MNKLEKRQNQLGMNPSTASGRLVKDILYSFVVQTGNDNCYHCKQKINREDFSIEHKTPWLDSENPQELFFNLSNIAFSHLSCNCGAARTRPLAPCGTNSAYRRGCRCRECTDAAAAMSRQVYTKEKRHKRWLRNGK